MSTPNGQSKTPLAYSRLRELLAQAAWQSRIAQLPGYAPQASGQVLSLRRELPWWQLAPRTPAGQG